MSDCYETPETLARDDFRPHLTKIRNMATYLTMINIYLFALIILASNFCLASETLEVCREVFQSERNTQPTILEEQKPAPNTLIEYEIEEEYRKLAMDQTFWDNLKLTGSTLAVYAAVSLPFVIYNYRNQIAPPHPQAKVKIKPVPLTFWRKLLSSISPIATQIFSPFLISNLISEEARRFTSWAQSNLQTWGKKPLVWAGILKEAKDETKWDAKVEISAFQIKYNAIKSTLPLDHQRQIEIILGRLEKQYLTTHQISFTLLGSESDKKVISDHLKIIDHIMRLPVKTKKLNNSEFREPLSNLLSHYHDDIKNTLTDFVSGISRENNSFRPIVYFQGAPGTGKTYFAKRLASTLGLPFAELTLKNSEGALEELTGRDPRFGMNPNGGFSKFTLVLADLPADQKVKNVVIFIDEVDKVLNAQNSGGYSGSNSGSALMVFLLKLFDRDTKMLRLHDLGVEVDISKAIFVLAGNAPITSSNEFMRRVHVVNFGSFDQKARTQIACKHFAQVTRSLNINEAEIKAVSELAEIDHKTNIGIKALLSTLDEYSNYLALKKSENGLKRDFDLGKNLEHHSQAQWDPYTALEFFKRKFETKIQTLSPKTIEFFEKHLKLLEQEIPRSAGSQQDLVREGLKSYFSNLETVMKLPDGVKNLEEVSTDFLKIYPLELQPEITGIIQKHIANSHKANVLRKNVLYFYGEPGTGKTFLAENIARTLGLPVIEFSLEGANYGELVGNSYGDSDLAKSPLKLSRLTGSLQKGSVKNAVIIIDEAEKVLNSKDMESAALRAFMLKFLDPDKREIRLEAV